MMPRFLFLYQLCQGLLSVQVKQYIFTQYIPVRTYIYVQIFAPYCTASFQTPAFLQKARHRLQNYHYIVSTFSIFDLHAYPHVSSPTTRLRIDIITIPPPPPSFRLRTKARVEWSRVEQQVQAKTQQKRASEKNVMMMLILF